MFYFWWWWCFSEETNVFHVITQHHNNNNDKNAIHCVGKCYEIATLIRLIIHSLSLFVPSRSPFGFLSYCCFWHHVIQIQSILLAATKKIFLISATISPQYVFKWSFTSHKMSPMLFFSILLSLPNNLYATFNIMTRDSSRMKLLVSLFCWLSNFSSPSPDSFVHFHWTVHSHSFAIWSNWLKPTCETCKA